MQAFWTLARTMFRYRGALTGAFTFAIVSALGLGVGLLIIPAMLQMLLREGRTLPDLALEFDAEHEWITVPAGLIERLPTDTWTGVLVLLSGVFLLTVIGATANFVHQYLAGSVAARTVGVIRARAFHRAVHLPLPRVITRGPSEFVARIVRDTSELQRGFISLTSKTVAHVSKGAAALVAAVFIEWKLTLIAVPTALILGITLRKLGKRIRRGTRGSLAAQESLLRMATETLTGLRAVKTLTAEETVTTRFGIVNDDVVRHELRVRTARAASGPLVETLAVSALIVLAIIAARLILAGTVDAERLFGALVTLGVAGTSFRPVAGLVTEMQAASAPAQRLIDIMDEPRERPGEALVPRHAGAIELEHVTVRYPGAETPALDDVSVRLEHGTRIAVVGPNGSGKTTLISLVPRLIEPVSGRVTIDDVDLARASLPSLREQIAVVTQDTVLFRGTVAENIELGRPGAPRAEIIEAARRALAHDFIEQLPEGYDTNLAEQGASLSGGQRQRLAIARAILRDPAILILDEATSQIDAESEDAIARAIEEFSDGRTVLIVAHRLTTVRSADRILVMDQGRIVDDGPHERLLEGSPLYARLAKTQFAEV